MQWIDLAQDRDRWRTLLHGVTTYNVEYALNMLWICYKRLQTSVTTYGKHLKLADLVSNQV